jgi:RNA polymerase sigma-70 factor (sigma-E family)
MDFETYARSARLPLLRYAVVLTDDPELAQDLVHDVLLKAQQSWSSVVAAEYPHAYVRRMLTNQLISWRRKWGRVQPRPDRDLDRTIDDPTDAVDRRDALLRSLSRLPARQRAAIVMRYLEDMADADIAEALGCGLSTVRVHIHRGLAALRVTQPTPVGKDS